MPSAVTELEISGMSCARCLQTVRDALAAVAGVTRVRSLELEGGRALVEGDQDPQALVAAVRGAGYDARVA
jgi:copper chaperone CopZ